MCKHKTNLERDPDHQLLQVKGKSAVNMRARIVKHSVDSATLHDWVIVYSAEVKAIPVKARTGLLRPQEFETLRFPDSRNMKVVSLSGLRTGRIYCHEIFLILIFIRGCVDPRAIVSPEGLNQRKIPMTSSGVETYSLELKKVIVPCELCGCTRKENVCENLLIKMKRDETPPDNLTSQTSALTRDLNT
jgi:hypothetical protein